MPGEGFRAVSTKELRVLTLQFYPHREYCSAMQAWSVNRYAMVARKHGLYHTCINIINSMYGFNAMEVQEAFTKIKEQVR